MWFQVGLKVGKEVAGCPSAGEVDVEYNAVVLPSPLDPRWGVSNFQRASCNPHVHC